MKVRLFSKVFRSYPNSTSSASAHSTLRLPFFFLSLHLLSFFVIWQWQPMTDVKAYSTSNLNISLIWHHVRHLLFQISEFWSEFCCKKFYSRKSSSCRYKTYKWEQIFDRYHTFSEEFSVLFFQNIFMNISQSLHVFQIQVGNSQFIRIQKPSLQLFLFINHHCCSIFHGFQNFGRRSEERIYAFPVIFNVVLIFPVEFLRLENVVNFETISYSCSSYAVCCDVHW